jgi:hypothetical protein
MHHAGRYYTAALAALAFSQTPLRLSHSYSHSLSPIFHQHVFYVSFRPYVHLIDHLLSLFYWPQKKDGLLALDLDLHRPWNGASGYGWVVFAFILHAFLGVP